MYMIDMLLVEVKMMFWTPAAKKFLFSIIPEFGGHPRC